MATYKDILELVDKVSAPLKKIQENAKKTTAATDKLKERINGLKGRLSDIGNSFNKFGGKLKEIGGNFAKLAKRAAVAFTVITGAMTYALKKTADFGDRIDKMSQKIGMSRKSFQEWDYIMSQNGGSVESLQMGFKTLTTQIEGVQKGSKDSVNAFRALGVNVKNANGQFRTQDEIFNDTIRKLQQIKNPTQKAMLANRLFGRSAAELRPLLNQEASAIDNLREKANKLGLIISDKDIDNAVILKDTFDTFSRAFQARFASAVMKIMPYFTSFLEKITPLINQTYIYFSGLIKEMTKTEAFENMKMQFNELIAYAKVFYSENKEFFDTLKTAFEWTVTTGIPNLIASFSVVLKWILQLTNTAFKIIKDISGAIGSLIGWIISIPTQLEIAFIKAQTLISNIFKSIKSIGANAIQFIIDKLMALLNGLGTLANKIPLLRSLGNIASDIGKSITTQTYKQTQNNKTINNTTTNNNYYGNTRLWRIMADIQAQYAI